MTERIDIKEEDIRVLYNADTYPDGTIVIDNLEFKSEEAQQLKQQILDDYTFAERCRKDGIITYSKECEENKQIVNRLKEEIEICNKKECVKDMEVLQTLLKIFRRKGEKE